MEQVKTDLRVIRTRKTIIESFLLLSEKKSFNDISVKDITSEAMINRATFYNHFMDKYDLLEQVVSEKLSLNLDCRNRSRHPHSDLEKEFQQVFVSLISFLQSSVNIAKSQEEKDTVQFILETKLTSVFTELLAQNNLKKKPESAQKLARFLTHSFIGLSSDYVKDDNHIGPSDYISSLLPFLVRGVSSFEG